MCTIVGEEHADTLASMNNLAFTWKGQGRGAEAIKLMEKCVQLATLAIGAGHPHTLSSSAALIRWQNHDSSVDQSPQKRTNGKRKWWQWKGRKTGNS